MKQQCGYVALVGRPNAGKSTLLNAILGAKLAGVSRKPQTTRNRILGVLTTNTCQYLFLDTPGIHSSHKAYLNKAMNAVTDQVLLDASVVVYLIDINVGINSEDEKALAQIFQTVSVPILILLTQADRLLKNERRQREQDALSQVSEYIKKITPEGEQNRWVLDKPLVFTSKSPVMLQELLEQLKPLLPESPWLYPEDDLTDRSGEFLASELIREQVFRCLGKEVPYETAVKVTELTKQDKITRCTGEIILARASHKPIVIGKKGEKIKEIGVLSRPALEKLFENKVYLELHVKVQRDWIHEKDEVENLAHLLELQEEKN